MRIEFTAYGEAKPAGSKTGFVVKDKRTGKQRAVVVDACKTTKPWQACVHVAAREAIVDCVVAGGGVCKDANAIFDKPIIATFRFYFPRPKSHFNSKGELKANAPAFITKKPDVLKLARAVEDAMTGIVYRDDSQIVQEHLFKSFGEPARCEVKIETLT
jgi:crossover junction endodeoxyribonuclease RusA